MSNEPADREELYRLWRAVRRDLGTAILGFAGIGEFNDRAWKRLCRNWQRLCAADLDTASSIYHGLHEVSAMMALYDKADSPADHQVRELNEIADVVSAGREASPDAEVATAGELYALGEQALRDEVGPDTEDMP